MLMILFIYNSDKINFKINTINININANINIIKNITNIENTKHPKKKKIKNNWHQVGLLAL